MKRMKSMDIQALLELYIQAAQSYVEEIRGGTSRAANRHHSVAERVFKEMRRRGAEREILMLLSHPRSAVRLWAAIHSLGVDPDSAQTVLSSLSETASPTIRMYANLALDQFKKGELPES